MLGALISLVLMISVHWGEAPVWERVSIGVAIPLVALGLGSILAASEMSYRLWRTDDSEAIDVLPASPRVRTGGQLAAVTALVLLGVGLQAAYMVYLLFQDPVGTISWWEVASGPAVVAVMALYGLAAGRWFPSAATGPVAVLVLVAAHVALNFVGGLSWLALVPKWDMLSSMEGPPPELAFRPTAIHVGYLAVLAGVFVCIALLRGRWRHGALIPLTALFVFLSLGIVLGVSQLGGPSEQEAEARVGSYVGENAEYECETRGIATYCAYPGYEGWIDEWAAAVEPVIAQMPDGEIQPLQVRQYPLRWMDVLQLDEDLQTDIPSRFEGLPYMGEDIRTGLWWGRGPGNLQTEAYPFGMSLGAAAWAVGLPTTPPETSPDNPYYSACHLSDQGRGIVAVWLAGQSSGTAHEHIHNVFEEYETRFPGRFEEFNGWIGDAQSYPWYRTEFTLAQFRYADQLLHRRNDEVAALVEANWETLIARETTIIEAVELLGLDPIEWQPVDWQPDPTRLCP
ncbi:MAG: hypothetical protein J5I28_05140 [Acidimicrobiales bacterium]|nr:hypothetical protein [Acidimicrobiales bacterium]